MGRYDRREWQKPQPPFPERERPVKKRGSPKPWKLEARYIGPDYDNGWPRESAGSRGHNG